MLRCTGHFRVGVINTRNRPEHFSSAFFSGSRPIHSRPTPPGTPPADGRAVGARRGARETMAQPRPARRHRHRAPATVPRPPARVRFLNPTADVYHGHWLCHLSARRCRLKAAVPAGDFNGEKPHETDVHAAHHRFDERAFARYVFLRNPSRSCFRSSKWGHDPATSEWFLSLKDSSGQSCCDYADGVRLEAPEWRRLEDNSFEVFARGKWTKILPGRVLNGTNKVGYAILWWPKAWDNPSCFLPGAEN